MEGGGNVERQLDKTNINEALDSNKINTAIYIQYTKLHHKTPSSNKACMAIFISRNRRPEGRRQPIWLIINHGLTKVIFMSVNTIKKYSD